MKLNRYTLIISSCVLFFCGCKKGELPVTAHNPGDVITATVNMNADYKWQVFYSLKTNHVVNQVIKTTWDLGFDATPAGYAIILNSSKVMFAFNTATTNFSAVTDTVGFTVNKKWDNSNGSMDSTAIGDWRNTSLVYIVDRGYNETGIHQGFRKIQFQQVDADKYVIRFANLNGTEYTELIINKDSRYNFMFLSLENHQLVTVEPPKATWDLAFTQYTHIFYNPTTTYLVTGCLLNRFNTQAVVDSTVGFSEITYNLVANRSLTNNINSIGYNWKTYTGGTYITHSKRNYIIKNSEGIYYKLHFIDFFNASGKKGNPKWEFQQL